MKTRDTGLDYALYQAVRYQKTSTTQALLDSGANPNGYVDADRMTCAHWAAKNADSDILSTLINAGADITLRDKEENTPIVTAAIGHRYYENWEAVKTIAKQANNILENDYQGHRVALLIAIAHNHSHGIEVLLNAGTPLQFCLNREWGTLKGYVGYSPLHIAVANNDANLVKQLLTFSADPNYKGNIKESPIQMAARLKKWSCVQAFAKHDKTFTGKAIYQKLNSSLALTSGEYDKFAPYKEAVFAYMLQMKDQAERLKAFEKAKESKNVLGHYCWWRRGSEPCSLEKGMLRRIEAQIKIEQSAIAKDVTNINSVQTTAKVMNAVAAAPVPAPSVALPSAPPVEVRYYPDLSAQVAPLMPIYQQSYTFTNQMNSLPNMKDMPALPAKKEEQKKVAVAGF